MIVVETFIICDGNCGTNFGVDNRNMNGAYHRGKAKMNGWKYVNGKDFCPECWNNKTLKTFSNSNPNK